MLGSVLLIIIIVGVTMVGCYFLSGMSNIAGTIFERKSTIKK